MIRGLDAGKIRGMDDVRREIHELIDRMMDDPTVTIDIERGVRDVAEPGDVFRKFEPTDGMTLTVKVNGGAREEPPRAAPVWLEAKEE
jgi:hypothetical protein